MNYISLGYFCSIAMELERLGLRKESSPFDWLISDFQGVIQVIDNHFEDFLSYEYLAQNATMHERYRNEKYQFQFFHDFDKYVPLEKQIAAVRQKYDRRIERFYQTIKSPTLFIRYISDKEKINGNSKELLWIEENYDWIMGVLKSYNVENDILFIANKGVTSDKFSIYNVMKDENDEVARKPIEKNPDLWRLLSDVEFEGKNDNVNRYLLKEKKKNSLWNKTVRKLKKIMKQRFFREYIHIKQY